jgi:hypothetical protein
MEGMYDTERVVWMSLGQHDSERSCSMQAGNSMDSVTTINATKDSATYKHDNVYWIHLAKDRV